MNYKPLRLSDIETLRPYFEKNLCRICDCTVGGTFMWRDFYKTEYAIKDGILYFKVIYLPGVTAFTPPHGDISDEAEAYETIREECRALGIPPRVCAVSKGRLQGLLEIYPSARYETDRAWSDYLYRAEDLITLAGRRYSGQRNHINAFLRTHPDWSFDVLSEDNRAEIRAFFARHFEEQPQENETYTEGNRKTLEVLDHLELYRILGGALRADGEIIGAALGEKVGDTLFVHSEKALKGVRGAYQMLVNQFSKTFGSDVAFINREEDDGVEGLRTAKLAYHPAKLLDKYLVELPS